MGIGVWLEVVNMLFFYWEMYILLRLIDSEYLVVVIIGIVKCVSGVNFDDKLYLFVLMWLFCVEYVFVFVKVLFDCE